MTGNEIRVPRTGATIMSEELRIRIHGEPALPALIYLPGLHGDWTLVGSFRRALGGQARFVEFTYPRTLTWSLEDYAAAIESALVENGITRGWLLGESFGSQIAWPLVARGRIQVSGIILAGGFARHPLRRGARLAERIGAAVPRAVLARLLNGYAVAARFRYRHAPETRAEIHEFLSRRTELDRQAAAHRLRLVALNDPRAIAAQLRVPLFALSGWLDPIVFWPATRRWFRCHCPALREFKILGRADHNVLGTAPDAAAKLVLRWMKSNPR